MIEKKQLEFIEKEKQRQKEEDEKRKKEELRELERKKNEELQRQKEENEKRKKEELRELERKKNEELQRLKEENEKKQKEKITLNFKDILDSINNYQSKISEIKQKIEKLKGEKNEQIVGTVLSSIFIPLSLGLSGFAVAGTTIQRNKLNAQIKSLESDLANYKNELNRLENLRDKLYQQFC